MALTLHDLIEELRERFQLEYLACEENTDHVVTWVHMMEDTSVAEFFWGNELVVTTGYGAHDEAGLLRMVEVLQEKRAIGLVINIGRYFTQVPPAVVQRCRELEIPLLTMPWKMFITEFVKSCCSRIDQSTQEMVRLTQSAIHAIQSPNDEEGYYGLLTEYFDNAAGFQVIVTSVDVPDAERRQGIHRAELRFHTALYRWGFQSLVFQLEQRFVLVLNQTDPQVTNEIAHRVVRAYRRYDELPDARYPIHVGVGDPVSGVSHLANSYHAALSAVRRAELQGTDLVRFSEMGFYKLLYSVPDSAILSGFFRDTMGPLLDYDDLHEGAYVETLFRYLLNDCSLQAVAEAMYTHRNTVNYRMGKIRELLGKQLSTQSERLPFLLAYHIGVILRLVEDYEAEGEAPPDE